ncbi:efflux RND transporter periplasmic adaptor subunit [Pseudomonas sp. Q1-7]|uniref:efflux RND transporter periplasmic adaptor subunit n=1 Tax=Pseudomonas sp. Q1-7 TaxID=3020843 RepID=UPI002301F912|nr:efflux RND transporter periplasmic adaptor subunit [Pseudomonas sp. Q1-7]
MSVQPKTLAFAIGALIALGGAGGLAIHQGTPSIPSAQAAAEAPAVEVDVAPAIGRTISEWQSYSGRLEATEHIQLRPLVGGTIVSVHLKDGGLVKQGDLLFTIDPRPYQAAVERARAELAAAEARASYAATDAERARRLITRDAIAKREFDERVNAGKETAAAVKAAKAALQAALLDLDHTRITAPVSGRVSRAELTVGNIVAAGASAPLLATLVSVSPIYASFEVDEQTYLRYLRGASGTKVPVALGLADESGYSREGELVSVDNQLNTGTSTLRVRARFDNADGALLPGLFARVKVEGGKPYEAVLISDAAVGTDQAKKFVLVVDERDRVQYREVVLGGLHEGLRIVTQGLKAGERIVVSGVQRVRPNDLVQVHDTTMQASQPLALAN